MSIDGHLSHLLEWTALCCRCSPPVLSNRLEGRSYAEEKIRSNVEWELMAGHWSELLEFGVATPVLELDSTVCPTNELLEHVEAWVNEPVQIRLLNWLSAPSTGSQNQLLDARHS